MCEGVAPSLQGDASACCECEIYEMMASPWWRPHSHPRAGTYGLNGDGKSWLVSTSARHGSLHHACPGRGVPGDTTL